VSIETIGSVSGPSPSRSRGAFVLVVGPSGAGKDTLLDGARAHLAHDAAFVFPRRVVTRVADSSEQHASMSVTSFLAARNCGAFVFSWHAHGLFYGIDANVRTDVEGGRFAVINSSRGIISEARARFPNTKVILVDSPPEMRAERLARRGRETAEEIMRRLWRPVESFDHRSADIVVRNDSTPEEGIGAFAAALQKLASGVEKLD
jgi:phosphonate metabolism protein PhnN/1,5-bisphosphokinase (PRPP-forming)